MKSRWTTYTFRCSCLPQLMTQGKSKGELLGDTAKTYLREVWIEETFGRKKFDSHNKFTDKGIQVESDSLALISDVLGEKLFKNNKRFKNRFIQGTPDVATPVLDAKSSWDIFTFFAVDEKKARSDYRWQMVGYMILKKVRESRLVYSLVTTPVEITESELYKLSFSISDDLIDIARKNYVYDDIRPDIRVKVFNFLLEEDDENRVINQIRAARKYLKQLDKMNL